jgi:Ca2+-binding EF-hand superfamily protein
LAEHLDEVNVDNSEIIEFEDFDTLFIQGTSLLSLLNVLVDDVDADNSGIIKFEEFVILFI